MAYEFFGLFTSESELEEAIYKHLKRDSAKWWINLEVVEKS